jgi:hypothetical protein
LETQYGLTEYTSIGTFQSSEELAASRQLAATLKNSPVPDREIIAHLGLYLDRSALAHILFIHELYTRILNVHGVIIELGVRWGRNLAQFTELRNLYEPRNAARRIIGFDTFAGFPGVAAQDGASEGIVAGAYAVKPGYETELASLLSAHERFGLRSHLQKFEVVKGNIIDTLPEYLARHPETIVALAYFDLDLYEGTRQGLELIRDRLVKGSVVVFDELGLPQMPGETQALLDTWGLRDQRIQRSPMSHFESFVVVE